MDSATLITGHRAIAQAAEAMLATLDDTPVDVNMLARHRMTLSLRIRDQLRLEDRMVMPLLNVQGTKLPLVIRDLLDHRARLLHQYSGHVGRWNLRAVSVNLADFHTETTALITELFAFLTIKERMLFPYAQSLADQSPPAASRPIPPLSIAS